MSTATRQDYIYKVLEGQCAIGLANLEKIYQVVGSQVTAVFATGTHSQTLKDRFGEQLVFWGGGIDTQKTLPFGTPDEIRAQVRERMRIFGKGGGFVFNTIHNVQTRIPVENLLALYQAVADYR